LAYRIRRRMSRSDRRLAVSAVAVGVGIAALSGHGGTAAPGGAPSQAAARAIAYALKQLGKPYEWGGTGPYAFDCSGLVMEAYAHAGVGIARTSQAQWATERHVSSPRPGDLVFYPGADGTWTAPGHVALVVGGGQMIEAYGTGWPIREVPIRAGAVGYSQSWGGA
jgi:cell wall-associated NlpC family hydrolase